MTHALLIRDRSREGRTQNRRPCEVRQRWKWCGHKPRNVWSPQKLEETEKDFPLQPSERVWPCQHLDFGCQNFWPPELWQKIIFCCGFKEFYILNMRERERKEGRREVGREGWRERRKEGRRREGRKPPLCATGNYLNQTGRQPCFLIQLPCVKFSL